MERKTERVGEGWAAAGTETCEHAVGEIHHKSTADARKSERVSIN